MFTFNHIIYLECFGPIYLFFVIKNFKSLELMLRGKAIDAGRKSFDKLVIKTWLLVYNFLITG